MQEHRCHRCDRVVATVSAPAGCSSALLDPVVERRVLEAVARHAVECVARHAVGPGAADPRPAS